MIDTDLYFAPWIADVGPFFHQKGSSTSRPQIARKIIFTLTSFLRLEGLPINCRRNFRHPVYVPPVVAHIAEQVSLIRSPVVHTRDRSLVKTLRSRHFALPFLYA
jgi:hypothetical protein